MGPAQSGQVLVGFRWEKEFSVAEVRSGESGSIQTFLIEIYVQMEPVGFIRRLDNIDLWYLQLTLARSTALGRGTSCLRCAFVGEIFIPSRPDKVADGFSMRWFRLTASWTTIRKRQID